MGMSEVPAYSQWQRDWGCPRGLLAGADVGKLEAAFLLALLLHGMPVGLLWHRQMRHKNKPPDAVLLQNVDLMEPESALPPAPPPQETQKPKSALEFLKMAIPIFRKRVSAPEILRDIVPLPKAAEPKIAEPERLMEKKMPPPSAAPQIRLDANRIAPPPKIAEIAKLPSTQRAVETRPQDFLKLEEVGRKAVAPPPSVTPSISLDASRRAETVADPGALTKSKITAAAPAGDRLVEKSYSGPTRPPAIAKSLPLGYERRGGGVSLDQPREFVRAGSQPRVETAAPKTRAKEEPATLSISKDRVRITGPLSSRKVLKFFVPGYPDWAKAQNVEADVAIRFTVSPGGDVLGTVIERTSGYSALDKAALEELKKWKFSTLSGSSEEQWGVITFRYLLE